MERLGRRAMRGGLIALAFGIGGAKSAAGQAALLGPGAGFIVAGVSGIATRELDDRLAARGYPTFGRTATAVGIGAYRVLASRVMLGGEFHGLMMGEETHEAREVGLGGGYATLGVGYAMELSPRTRVYPRLGVGVGGLGLSIESDEEADFDEVLADPGPVPNRDPVLSRSGVVVDLGGGAELLPAGRRGGPMIGVRFGYLAAPFNTSWWMYDRKATGGPAATIAGPYVRVVIGGVWSR